MCTVSRSPGGFTPTFGACEPCRLGRDCANALGVPALGPPGHGPEAGPLHPGRTPRSVSEAPPRRVPRGRPPAGHEAPVSPRPSQHLSLFSTASILMGGRWSLAGVLIPVSLTIRDIEHLSVRKWPLLCLLWRNVYLNLLPIFWSDFCLFACLWGGVVFFMFNCRSSLHILAINIRRFPPFCGCLSTPLIVSFDARILILITFRASFLLVSCDFGVCPHT